MHYFTAKDQLRLDFITRYLEGEIHKEHALTALDIGERQFRRLVRRFRKERHHCQKTWKYWQKLIQ